MLILGGYVSVQGMAKRGGVDEILRALRYINRGGRRIRGDRKEVLDQTEYTPTRTLTHIMKLLFISLTLSALLATASAAPLTSAAAAAAADSSSSKVYRSIGDPMYRIRRDGLPPLLG